MSIETLESQHDQAATPVQAGPPPGRGPTPAASMRWVPVPEDAFQAALKIRAQVQKKLRLRPDVSLVVAAMLHQPADIEAITQAVARAALAPYASAPAGPAGV